MRKLTLAFVIALAAATVLAASASAILTPPDQRYLSRGEASEKAKTQIRDTYGGRFFQGMRAERLYGFSRQSKTRVRFRWSFEYVEKESHCTLDGCEESEAWYPCSGTVAVRQGYFLPEIKSPAKYPNPCAP